MTSTSILQSDALDHVEVTQEQDEVSAEYLSFTLAHERYCIGIDAVEEIRVWEIPTPIPHAPEYVKGVINIRGMIVPIIDLRIRFALAKPRYTPTTVVLVLRCDALYERRLMGMVVDAVSDVVRLPSTKIKATVGESSVTPFMLGLVSVDAQIISLLDAKALMDISQIVGGL
ncbi:purine-binding chemotaxis protein CheW [Vibrio sp. SM6]|uniref:Chemotaxis protein CheW n=1 Tax=Vibrio agarilyticus TaxID=2726741 RepID=A0A7X8TND7_9VIBR|nr:chemotaxis protein CheW [Vibrio agarilyticus]NLS11931.1 purine-binding chemotaxis protein CheW [Vibrio agarilyticus]